MGSNSEQRYVASGRGFPTKCDCGLPVTIYTSKTQDNPGRPFFRCISKKDEHLFLWVEDCVHEEVEDALPKLRIIEREITNAKSEVEELKTLIEELKENVTWSKMEIRKWKRVITLCLVCLCLMAIVFAYFMFGKAKKDKFVIDY